jgi:hypothetical protein
MANPNSELPSLRVAARSDRTSRTAAQPRTHRAGTGDRDDSLSAVGWRVFGPMRRGWVIVTLAVLGWAMLVAVGLALFGLIGAS